jgi:hypothetical protein
MTDRLAARCEVVKLFRREREPLIDRNNFTDDNTYVLFLRLANASEFHAGSS